jgi:hypothetical protein
MSEAKRAKVRAQRVLKHYRDNLLTSPLATEARTVIQLISDLKVLCDHEGLPLQDLVEQGLAVPA